jgi:ABC-type Fe3+ transport system substrate-binding protein
MKGNRLGIVLLCATFGIWQYASAATINPPLAKTKAEAESRGYVFLTSHDSIVWEAKKEGKLRVVSGLSPESIKTMIGAFRKKYPFIDVSALETTGSHEHQRILLELKAGTNKEWDAISMANDFYNEYGPYRKKFDILGMAQNGVLQIQPNMIDPKSRDAVSVTDMIQIGVTYNKNIIVSEKTPQTWEDFLKPEFKGKKIMVDIRPTEIAALVPAWGLEKTLAFARKLVAQDPVWVRGGTRAIASLLTGEYPMAIGQNYRSVRRAQLKDRTGTIAYKMFEPVPVRPSESLGIIATTSRPHAALLWLEFQASPEGQKIMDQFEPFGGSVHAPGSIQGQEIKGKKLSVVDWDHYTKLSDYQDKIVAAYGFPKAEAK